MFEYWVKTDLTQMPTMKNVNGRVFFKDSGANKIGVIVTKNGQSVTLNGSVEAWVITGDGQTIHVGGSREGNKAWAVLPAAAYAAEGTISVFIKLVNGTKTTTLGGICAQVYPAMTNENA